MVPTAPSALGPWVWMEDDGVPASGACILGEIFSIQGKKLFRDNTNVMPSAGMCSGCVVLLRFPACLRAGGGGKGRALHRSVATVGKERPK